MESTSNFRRGLQLAYNQLKSEGRLTEKDRKVVGTVLTTPVLRGPDGRRVFAMTRLHVRARRLYSYEIGAIPFDLDWTSLVQWIKDHWLDILKFLLLIAPFLI
jgi:hypothetical protein